MELKISIPAPPVVTEEELKKSREHGDYSSILFEWYKFVSRLCLKFSCVEFDQKSLSFIKPIHYAVLIGLLNRCGRLMFSNIALSHKGFFGETTAIIDRCIFESSVKISWLCVKGKKERIELFIADGLNTELKFKNKILKDTGSRDRKTFAIKEQLLFSIDKDISSSGLSEDKIDSIKKFPTLSSILSGKQNEFLYTIGQKIGSHAVHGTWPELLRHYIVSYGDGIYSPKDHNCKTNIDQYALISLMVLQSLESFLQFVSPSLGDVKALLEVIQLSKDEISKIYYEAIGSEYE